jgi:hypothetical protein
MFVDKATPADGSLWAVEARRASGTGGVAVRCEGVLTGAPWWCWIPVTKLQLAQTTMGHVVMCSDQAKQ